MKKKKEKSRAKTLCEIFTKEADERRGMLSASAVESAALCPGKPAAEKGLPDEQNPDAIAGTKMHTAFEVGDVSGLTDPQRKTVLLATDLLNDLRLVWSTRTTAQMFPEDEQKHHYRERRVWGFEDRLSGKFDGLVIEGDRGLIYDLKTGYVEAMEAPRNFQLRALAVLAALEFKLAEVTVAIIQPNVYPQTSEAVYGEEELDRSRAEIEAIIARAENPAAKRTPGPIQCKFCRAKTTCPEALEMTQSIAKITPDEITLAQLPDLLDACAVAEKMIAAIRKRARAEIDEVAGSIPGWRLKQGAMKEKVILPEELWRRIHKTFGIAAHDFAQICDVSKTKLKALVKEASGLKGKALDEALGNVLDGVVEAKRNAASLSREVNR